MGYCLDIDMVGESNPICCGKLFGYVEDDYTLLSCQWLLNNEYIEPYVCFGYGFEGNIVLIGRELIEFLNLYIIDLGTGSNELKERINNYISNLDKYKKYVLMWG